MPSQSQAEALDHNSAADSVGSSPRPSRRIHRLSAASVDACDPISDTGRRAVSANNADSLLDQTTGSRSMRLNQAAGPKLIDQDQRTDCRGAHPSTDRTTSRIAQSHTDVAVSPPISPTTSAARRRCVEVPRSIVRSVRRGSCGESCGFAARSAPSVRSCRGNEWCSSVTTQRSPSRCSPTVSRSRLPGSRSSSPGVPQRGSVREGHVLPALTSSETISNDALAAAR